MTTVGRRVYFGIGGWFKLEPGDYLKAPGGEWLCRVPDPRFQKTGSLETHEVIEHDDGTITVSPSILHNEEGVGEWHGFLERGIWRDA